MAVEQQAVFAVADDLPDARAVEGDDGHAGGHRLGEDQALGLGLRGEHEAVHGGVGVGEGGAGQAAGEMELILPGVLAEIF